MAETGWWHAAMPALLVLAAVTNQSGARAKTGPGGTYVNPGPPGCGNGGFLMHWAGLGRRGRV